MAVARGLPPRRLLAPRRRRAARRFGGRRPRGSRDRPPSAPCRTCAYPEGLDADARARRPAVDIDVPRLEGARCLGDGERAAREDARRQPVRRAVGHRVRLCGSPEGDQGDDRAEQLLGRRARLEGAIGGELHDQRAGGEVAGGRVERVEQHLALGAGGVGVAAQTLVRLAVDDRVNPGVGRVGGPDAEAARGGDEAVAQRLEDRLRDEDPRGRGALLVSVAERRGHHRLDDLVGVGVGEDEHRVLPTQLGDEALDLGRAGEIGHSHGLVEVRPDGARACEGDHVDLGALGEGGPGRLAAAGQGDQRIARHAGLVQECDESLADQRRLLGRLEDRGVPAGERGDGHAAGDRDREVPGRDHGYHAAMRDAVAEALEQRLRLRGVVAQVVDRLLDLRPGVRAVAAALVDHPGGEFVAALLEQLGGAAQDRRALGDRRARPARGARAGDRDRAPSPSGVREGGVANRLGVGVGRAVHRQLLGGGQLLVAGSKREVLAPARAGRRERHLEGVAELGFEPARLRRAPERCGVSRRGGQRRLPRRWRPQQLFGAAPARLWSSTPACDEFSRTRRTR